MSLITYLFVKFGCAICIFLNSENLICLNTDISKCFRGSLQLRDNKSQLYMNLHSLLRIIKQSLENTHQVVNAFEIITYRCINYLS